MNEKPYPVHESLLIGTLLTAAAGSFDAFTYLLHGEVFAGLQTGNVILLGIHLGQAQWTTFLNRCPLHGTDLRFHVRHHGRPRTATAGWQKITTFNRTTVAHSIRNHFDSYRDIVWPLAA